MALIRTPGAGEYLADVALDRINLNYPKQVFADAGSIPDEFTREYREQLSYRGFKRARLSNIREFIDDYSPWYEAVEAAGIPVLLTWGTADEVIRADSIAHIRNAIPSAEYHTIEGGGHVVHYENPEPVNTMLVDFFSR